MNWEMTLALTAIIGTIAVVAALLYVAYQLKAATKQRELESHHSVLNELYDSCKLLASDQSNSDVWWRASKGLAQLTDAERVRYFAMLFLLFRSWEKAFHYQREGGLEEWNINTIMKPMMDFAMTNGVQEYWALRKRWYAAEFRDWVDQQIKGRSGVDVYDDQFRIFGSADPRKET